MVVVGRRVVWEVEVESGLGRRGFVEIVVGRGLAVLVRVMHEVVGG